MTNPRLIFTASMIAFFILIIPAVAAAQVYTVISFDGKGDGRDASMADAAQLAYRYDKDQDLLSFVSPSMWKSE